MDRHGVKCHLNFRRLIVFTQFVQIEMLCVPDCCERNGRVNVSVIAFHFLTGTRARSEYGRGVPRLDNCDPRVAESRKAFGGSRKPSVCAKVFDVIHIPRLAPCSVWNSYSVHNFQSGLCAAPLGLTIDITTSAPSDCVTAYGREYLP